MSVQNSRKGRPPGAGKTLHTHFLSLVTPLTTCGTTEVGDTQLPCWPGASRAREGIQLLEKGCSVPPLPPLSHSGVLRVGSGTDPISNPRRQRDPGAKCTAGATRTLGSPTHLPLPPTCQSRLASWQPPRLSLLARSPPGAHSTSSSPRSRPPGHSPPRTPSRA